VLGLPVRDADRLSDHGDGGYTRRRREVVARRRVPTLETNQPLRAREHTYALTKCCMCC